MWGRPYRVKPRLRGLPKGPSRASARIYTLDAVPICTGGHREGASLRYSHDLRWLGEEAKCLLSSATNCHLAISHAHFAHDLLFYTLSYYFFAQHYTYETFISTGLNRCTCKREVIKSSCGLGQSNHKSWPSQNSQPLPFKSPHGPMRLPFDMFPFTILFIKYLQVHMMHEHILMLYLRDRTFLKELSLCIWLWTLIYILPSSKGLFPQCNWAGWQDALENRSICNAGRFLRGKVLATIPTFYTLHFVSA